MLRLYTEWVSKHVTSLLLKIVARTSNRVFVGPAKCMFTPLVPSQLLVLCIDGSLGRDDDYLKLVTDFAVNVIKKKDALDKIPEILKPSVFSC